MNKKHDQQFAKQLLLWYDNHRRVLPWREEPTPYHVWISEIMLQQTRVSAVIPYYERFLQRYPTIEALAHATDEGEDELLKVWEGLGYYSRVRNLNRAAVEVMTRYGGELPKEEKELLSLPGIGPYTAGAILSIAYGIPRPAIDGNVLRVFSRVCKLSEDITLPATVRKVRDIVEKVLPTDRPGAFNQALMDLGATVCVPNGTPDCGHCPVADLCKARGENAIHYPVKASKPPRRIEEKTILVIRDGSRVALHKRPNHGLLAGMYEFPMLDGHVDEREVIEQIRKVGFEPIQVTPLTASKHIFSHVEWHMIGYLIRVDELSAPNEYENRSDYIFTEPSRTGSLYPIAAAYRAYTPFLVSEGVKGEL